MTFPLRIVFAFVLAASPVGASTRPSTLHYLRALLLQRQGNFGEALKEFEESFRLDPRATSLLEQSTELALEVGQTEKALQYAEKYVEIEPKSAKAHVLLGQVRLARGEAALGQASFEKALRLEPNSAEAILFLGHLLSVKSPEEAKKYFQKYLTTNPANAAEAHFQIALVDQRQGRAAEAIRHLKAAIEIQPSNPQGHSAMAQLYEIQKDTDSALGEYQALLNLQPDDLAVLVRMGELNFLKGDLPAAESFFSRANDLSPHYPGSCKWLATLAEGRKDFMAAAHYLENSAALNHDPEVSLRLSYYLSQAGRIEDSVKVLENAHQRWPEIPDLDYFLALGYTDLKRFSEAAALLREMLKSVPDSQDARFQLGMVYEKMNKVPEMEREFKALLEKSPNNAAALNYLGYSWVDRGIEIASAEALIKRAVEIEPNNGAYRDSLGWVYFKQNKWAQALAELQRASQLLPEDPTVWEHLGDLYHEQKEEGKAWESWKISSAGDPENKSVISKIAKTESTWKPGALGERLVGFLAARRGALDQMAGFSTISATVGNRTVSLTGILSFKSPKDLSLEVLGPLFVPMFRLRLEGDQPFDMGSLSAEGIPAEELRSILKSGFGLIRDYLSGAVFEGRPVEFNDGWRTHWLSTSKYQLFLDEAKSRIQMVKTKGEVPVRLSLDGFRAVDGHSIPTFFRVDGKMFSITFQLQDPKIKTRPAPPTSN